MLSDEEIAAALAPARSSLPYPGTWLSPPYAGELAAVVAEDEGLSTVVVDRATGRVEITGDGGPDLIAPGLAALAELVDAYEQAVAAAFPETDEACEAAEAMLRERIAAIDAGLLANDESFWSVAAEEIGAGLVGGPEYPVVTARRDPSIPHALVLGDIMALLQEPGGVETFRFAPFACATWVGTSGSLAEDAAKRRSVAAAHGEPVPTFDVAVTFDDGAPLDPDVLAAFPDIVRVVHAGMRPESVLGNVPASIEVRVLGDVGDRRLSAALAEVTALREAAGIDWTRMVWST